MSKPKHNPEPWKYLDAYRGEGTGKFFNTEWPTLSQLFDITTYRFPQNQCFESFAPKHQLFTYAESQAIARGIANRLYELGVRRGDKVGLVGKNSPEWTLGYLSIAYAGATIVPLDNTMDEAVMNKLFSFAEVKVVLADQDRAARFAGLNVPVITLEGGKDESYILNARSQEQHPIEPATSKDLAAILFTSGTTGTPKGVMLTHENLTSDIYLAQGYMNIYPTDVFYAILPIHHAYTMLAVFLEAIGSGSKVVFGKKLVIKQVFRELKEGGVTMFLGVPMLFNKMITALLKGVKEKGPFVNGLIHALMGICGFFKKHFNINMGKHLLKFLLEKLSLENVRICISGGGPLPASTFRSFNQMGVDFVQGYGLTETSPIITLNPVFDYIETSVGAVLPHTEMKIVDPDSEGNGLIYVRGPMVMQGYYKNEEATREVLTEDGWLNTGDIGHLDSRNYLYLTGRQRNIIVTEGGKNVFPEEIEDMFQLYDDIDQICVKGYVSDAERKVEGIMAIVHPSDAVAQKYKDDRQGLLDCIATSISAVNALLPGYKKIRKLAISVEPLPINSTKKLQRFKLAEIDESFTKMI